MPGPNVRPGSRRPVFGQKSQRASVLSLSFIEQISAAQDKVSATILDARPYASLQTAMLKSTLVAGLLGITCRFGQPRKCARLNQTRHNSQALWRAERAKRETLLPPLSCKPLDQHPTMPLYAIGRLPINKAAFHLSEMNFLPCNARYHALSQF